MIGLYGLILVLPALWSLRPINFSQRFRSFQCLLPQSSNDGFPNLGPPVQLAHLTRKLESLPVRLQQSLREPLPRKREQPQGNANELRNDRTNLHPTPRTLRI